jgi:hypothetical protein
MALGGGRLAVRVAASSSAVHPSNRLRRLDVTSLTNAAVDVRQLTGRTQAFGLDLADQPAQLDLTVARLQPGPFTVRLSIEDSCGAWPTFVGGGTAVP